MTTKAIIEWQIDYQTNLKGMAQYRIQKLEAALYAIGSTNTAIKYELDGGADLIKTSYQIAGDKYDEYVDAEKELIEQTKSAFDNKLSETAQDLEEKIGFWNGRVQDHDREIAILLEELHKVEE